MSELERSASGPSHEDASAARDEDFGGLLGDRPEREGLPRSYRMRADTHYVDTLESRHEGPGGRVIPTRQIETPADAGCLHEVLQALSYDLAGMGSLVAFLRPAAGGLFQYQATADLLQAQAWRAAWLAGAAALVASPYRAGRAKPVGSIVERVRAGLEAEARLTKLQLDLSVAPEAAKCTVDENLGSALAGMILATLSWLQGSDEPRLEVSVDAPSPGSLRLQVVQRVAPMPEEAAQYLRASGSSRPGDLTTTIGLLTARTFAAQYSGTLEFTAIGRRGSVIQSVFSLDY